MFFRCGADGELSPSVAVSALTGDEVTLAGDELTALLAVPAAEWVALDDPRLARLAALAKRATEGGSWLVRLSLVQVAHWIGGLGTVDASSAKAELADEEIAAITMETDGPFGRA